MDKFRVIVIALGTSIIVIFSLYNFGFYLTPTVPQSGAQMRPISISSESVLNSNTIENPDKSGHAQKAGIGSVNLIPKLPPNVDVKMATYESREKPENFYSIQFPAYMNVKHGKQPGSLIAKSQQAFFSADLVDIPDDSNVELYLLTKVKPSLESSLRNFTEMRFSSTAVGADRAWQLAYTWKNSTSLMESIKTFVEGQDEAMAITYTGNHRQLVDKNVNLTLIQPVLQSFHWTG